MLINLFFAVTDMVDLGTTTEMTLSDMVLGIILLKQGDPNFSEDALAYVVKKAAENDSRLKGLFSISRDQIGDRSTGLDRVLVLLSVGGFYVTDVGDFQHVCMTTSGKEVAREELKESYGADVLEKLQPLAQSVWNYAKERK